MTGSAGYMSQSSKLGFGENGFSSILGIFSNGVETSRI